MGHFKDSQLAASRLRDIQTELDLPNKIIQQDVTTRWNSTFYMTKSLLEHWRVLGVYGANHKLLVSFTVNQWSLIENITTLLAPFEQLTKEISSDSATTADVIPSVVALKRLLSKTADTDFGVRTTKTTLAAVDKRFNSTFSEPLYYLSTILDPRYKDLYFDTALRATARDRLQKEIHIMMLASNEDTSDAVDTLAEAEVPEEKTRRRSDGSGKSLMDMYNKILEERQQMTKQQITANNPISCPGKFHNCSKKQNVF